MRVLEARFHPRGRTQPDLVMLGYLVWRSPREEHPIFEPARAAVPVLVRAKLEYLIETSAPDSFERLQRLRSEYWSFTPIAVTARAAEDEDQRGESADGRLQPAPRHV